ncbi:hypothetical protein [Agrobacterium pusense]|uniref:hypothetical protein n=1 Tax=Agrobacterium pusense TaxID=648995 RepID=UPI000D3ABDF6|nr:hypothetical protein [Agrobacterium pusense]PTV70257.1 hypothetical protein DBL06_25675 [Agrobacterium pusense]
MTQHTFSPFEIVGGKIQPKEDSIQVIEIEHLDPEAIRAEDAVVMLQAHGIPCKLRFLVGKTPRGIRLTKLPNAAHIPADKHGFVKFPLVQEIIDQITKFEAQHQNLFGTEYEYLIDSQKKPANDG